VLSGWMSDGCMMQFGMKVYGGRGGSMGERSVMKVVARSRVEASSVQGCQLSLQLHDGNDRTTERESMGVAMAGAWCGCLLYVNDIEQIAVTTGELHI